MSTSNNETSRVSGPGMSGNNPGQDPNASKTDSETVRAPDTQSVDSWSNPGESGIISDAPNRYVLVEERGQGGMGKVAIVNDQYLDREIALKESLTGSSSDDTFF